MLLNLIAKITNWILYTSLFAALCAVSLCMATERLVINAIPDIFSSLHILVFGSTLFVYNAHYLFKKSDEALSDRYAWSLHYKKWHYLFLISGALMSGLSLLFLSRSIFRACALLGVLSFAYSLPLLPFRNKRRIKDFGWIKIMVLTNVWTIVTSVLPILYWERHVLEFPFEILIRFVFMFTLCIAFDIRDMQTDMEAGIATLPNLIGLKSSYRLMHITLFFFVGLSIIQYARYPSYVRLSGELVTAIITWQVISYTRKHPSDRAYLGLVDGMMLVYGLLVLWH